MNTASGDFKSIKFIVSMPNWNLSGFNLRFSSIFSCQWIGTGIGEWCDMGWAARSIINFMGRPSIMDSAWCSYVMKVLDL